MIFNEGLRKVLNNQLPLFLPLGDATPVIFLHRIAESVSPPDKYTLSLPYQGIYINRYTYQSCWNVFLRGKSGGGQQPTDLLQFQSLLICNEL